MAREIVVGAAKLVVLNIGDLRFSLKDVIAVPESTWRPRYGDVWEKKQSYPSQSVLISVGGDMILVDAGEYWKFAAVGSEYVEEGYEPPPGLVEQLATMNVKPDQVGHVVITHAHDDHFVGVTTRRGEETVQTFPKARHYLGRGDWDWPELVKAIADQSSIQRKTLGMLHQLGSLELVSGTKELVPGVSILPAPGESPGHQILRVRSEGHTAYCIGDLFHDVVEFENPEWMASWCDPVSNLRSRKIILESAIREDAVVIPGHMRPGRIVRSDHGATYVESR